MDRLSDNMLRLCVLGVATCLVSLTLCEVGWANDNSHERYEDRGQRVDRLIEQLGADEFSTREKAQTELARLGLEAFDALYRARYHEDIEIAMRARYLVHSIPIRWTQEHDPLEVRRILRNYDQQSATERVSRMQRLALLPQCEGTEALCRLVRFETSGVLSKRAALLVISQPALETSEQRDELVRTMRNSVGDSQRPAADWVRAYALFLTDPGAAIEQWNVLTTREQEVFRQSPDVTSYETVRDLMRWHVEALSQLGRETEAMAVMRQAVQLRNGSPEDLLELVDWLLQRSAWPVLDEVAQKYRERFQQDARLAYRLAEAQLKQGEKDLAEEAARQAMTAPIEDRIVVASDLKDRGLFVWSEREFRHLIQSEPPGTRLNIEARISLAEMLHDQQRELAAAQALQPVVDLAQSNRAVRQTLVQWKRLDSTTSRMHFFYALHNASEGNRDQQIEHLRNGFESDPTDADVLIAMFRLPDPDPPWRKMTNQAIRSAADLFRQEVAVIRDTLRKIERAHGNSQNIATGRAILASRCNRFAWLIGNTEGDFQEALHCSQESLRLIPDEAGFLDTLGRCYYAVGDYENAVKSQSRAVELEPFSGLLTRQLTFFQEALVSSKKE